MTQKEEIEFFKRFIHALNPDNSWRFQSRDKPDIKLEMADKIIGIEITEILDRERRARQMLLKQIGDEVVSKLNNSGFEPFHLNLNFHQDLQIKKSEISAYSRLIANHIFELIGPTPTNQDYHFDFESTSTNGFIGFTILFSKKLSTSYFSESAAGFVPNLSEQQLIQLIKKKEKALTSYEHFDEQWLVIAEGNFLAGSVDKIEMDCNSFHSTFDKVFLFRQQKEEIIELKT